MQSRFKISNSSDFGQLNVATASLLPTPHLPDKGKVVPGQEELQLFIEQELLASKVDQLEQEEEQLTRLQVEPHSFTFLATPLTVELLDREEKARVRELARAERAAAKLEVESEESGSELPMGQIISQEMRRKTVGQTRGKITSREAKQNSKEVKQSGKNCLVDKTAIAGNVSKPKVPQVTKPLPLLKPPPDLCPLPLPNLPTSPIPVSELPPSSVRSPPIKSPPINPLLQNLTPIPQHLHPTKPLPRPQLSGLSRPQLPGLSRPQLPGLPRPQLTKPVASPAAPVKASGELISIQVPMAGPDGSQTLQTINVPRSLLAGASDRPILLTVTPKNGVNKGQKQIVVLTKSTIAGSGATVGAKSATITTSNMTLEQKQAGGGGGGASPTKSVQLSPRVNSVAQPTASPQVEMPVVSMPQPVAQLPPVPQSQQGALSNSVQQAALPNNVLQAVLSNSVQKATLSNSVQQAALFNNVQQPALSNNVQPSGLSNNLQQSGLSNNVQQGNLSNNVQQATLSNNVQQAALSNSVQQAATSNIVQQAKLPNNVQVAVRTGQGQTEQVIRGQLINTSQGQVLVQPGGRQILLGGPGSSLVQAGGKLVLTAGQNRVPVSQTQRVVAGEQSQGAQVLLNKEVQGGQVLRREQIVPGGYVIQGGQAVQGNQQLQGGRVVQSGQHGAQGENVIQGSQMVQGGQQVQSLQMGVQQVQGGQVVQSNHSGGQLVRNNTQLMQNSQVGGQGVSNNKLGQSGLASGGVPSRLVAPAVSSPSTRAVSSSQVSNGVGGSFSPASPDLNRILTALGNRGLVSQQNGKFYYVGDKGKSPVAVSMSTTPTGSLKLTASGPARPATTQAQTSSRFSIPGITSLKPTPVNQPGNLMLGSPAEQTTLPSTANPVPDRPQNTVVIADASSLDSFTASPHMLKLASSLLQNSIQPTTNGVQPQVQPPQPQTQPPSPLRQSEETQTFYYRDPVLPAGWYMRCTRTQVAELSYQVETSFFSSDGAMLRSQSEVAAYLMGQIVVRDKSHKPPTSITTLPWKSELDEINQQLVPSIQLPLQKPLKRPALYQQPDTSQEPPEKLKTAGNLLFL